MDKFVASQHETEEKYGELEEKRLKLTKELEEYRQQMQERWPESDRRHELQMWSMMMQMMGSSGLGGHQCHVSSTHPHQGFHLSQQNALRVVALTHHPLPKLLLQ